MRLQQPSRGRVTKVIHVRFAPSDTGCESSMEACDGYGILQDSNGGEIYFVDAALQNIRLRDLQIGTLVEYVKEQGPLQRASKIWALTVPLSTAPSPTALVSH